MQSKAKSPPSPLSLLLKLRSLPPRGHAKYLLLLPEINSRSKVMDHNVLMCSPFRCLHFNRGPQCLNHKARAVVDLLLATCDRPYGALDSVQGPRASHITAKGTCTAHGCDCESPGKAQGTLFKMAGKGEKNSGSNFHQKWVKN